MTEGLSHSVHKIKYKDVKESVVSSLVDVGVNTALSPLLSSVWPEAPVSHTPAAAAGSPAVEAAPPVVVAAPPAAVAVAVLDDGRRHRDIHVIADYEPEM